MKSKITVSPWMILFTGLCYYTHSMRMLGILMLIMTVHESGHLVTARIFHYPFQHFSITPLGLKMTLTYFGYRDAVQEMVILLCGPLMQCFIPVILQQLVRWHVLSMTMMEWGIMMNRNILVFNLMPVLPLDGGRIVLSLLNCILPFRQAQRTSLILSVIMTCILLQWYIVHRGSMCFVFVLIGLSDLLLLRKVDKDAEYFYLYRLFHPAALKVKVHDRQDLYRQRNNFFLNKGKIMTEKEWISHRMKVNKK